MKAVWAEGLERRLAWPLVWCFVFTIPWEKSVYIGEAGTLTRLAGAAALVAALIVAWLRRAWPRANLVLLAALAFVSWSALSWLWSLDRAASAGRAATFAQLLAMLWMIGETARAGVRFRLLMAAYLAGSAVAAGLTLSRYVRGLETYYRRYAAPGFDPNDMGVTLALAIPMALYLDAQTKGRPRWLYRCCGVLVVAGVLLTASRTALAVSLTGFALIPLLWKRTGFGPRAASLALLGLLVGGTLFLAPEPSRQRLASPPAEMQGGKVVSRLGIWKAGLKIFRAHQFKGVGSGAYPRAVEPLIGRPARAGHRYVAHNTYLSVLVETGLAGFGMFSFLIAAVVLMAWFLPAAERAVFGVLLAGWALGIFMLTWEIRKPGWLVFGLVMAAWNRSFNGAEGDLEAANS